MLRMMIAVGITCLPALVAHAQDEPPVDPLFASDELLEGRITLPVDVITKERPIEDYVAGKFQYTATDGKVVDLDVGVRTRGRFRLRPDVCPFPPLRLNFKKSQVPDTLFDSQNILKLVSHCRTGSFRAEQAVIAEYLAYRILNLLTDMSFQVRLLHIDYVNTDSGGDESGYGILIEHKGRLAERVGIPALTIERIGVAELEAEYSNLTSVYQLLIGNTDFSSIDAAGTEDCCHNFTPFGTIGGAPYYSIPYDFDMSGFVDAPYAIPNAVLRLDSVKERRYRGYCANNELLSATFEKFLAKRDEIETLIREQPELGSRKRREMLDYVDQFYRTISRDKSVNRQLVGRCL